MRFSIEVERCRGDRGGDLEKDIDTWTTQIIMKLGSSYPRGGHGGPGHDCAEPGGNHRSGQRVALSRLLQAGRRPTTPPVPRHYLDSHPV